MMGAWEKIVPALERLSGDTGVYLCNLVTGDMRAYAADKPVVAASVIKIPVMIEVFRQARDGLLDLNEIHRLSDDERLPSCGTLKAMHTGIEMTLLDLTRLMVIVSDNAATNILIRRVGMENVNRTIRELGCEKTCLRRLLFDGEAAARGIENSITAGKAVPGRGRFRRSQRADAGYSERPAAQRQAPVFPAHDGRSRRP